MTKTLAIDTSTFVMGVAITEGEVTLGEVTTNIKKNHSIRLMPAIEQLMKEVDVKPIELEKIVVANGPGSYTGVRIGVTTAKTLAWSLNIPVVGVSSLLVMAQAGRFYRGAVVPLIDARRGQVFMGEYKANGLEIEAVTQERLTILSDWLDQQVSTDETFLFIGQDVALHKDLILSKLGERAEFASGPMMLPKPSEIARLGQVSAAEESSHALIPNYLRLAEAEANWLKQQKEERNG